MSSLGGPPVVKRWYFFSPVPVVNKGSSNWYTRLRALGRQKAHLKKKYVLSANNYTTFSPSKYIASARFELQKLKSRFVPGGCDIALWSPMLWALPCSFFNASVSRLISLDSTRIGYGRRSIPQSSRIWRTDNSRWELWFNRAWIHQFVDCH